MPPTNNSDKLRMNVGTAMLDDEPPLSINGLQMIAPTPQKKLIVFNAEADLSRLSSTTSMFIAGMVEPIPTPQIEIAIIHQIHEPKFNPIHPSAIRQNPPN